MVRPKQNLDPGSQQWARSLETDVDRLISSSDRSSQTIDNTLSGLANSLSNLGDLVGTLATQQAQLTAQQAQLVSTVTDLASRVSITSSWSTFNTGTIPPDGVWRSYGPAVSQTINVPTGKLLVTVGCAEASVATDGTDSMGARSTFSIPGVVSLGDFGSRVFVSGTAKAIGAPLVLIRSITLTPGVYTVTGQMQAYAFAPGSCNFNSPFMTLQVTGS